MEEQQSAANRQTTRVLRFLFGPVVGLLSFVAGVKTWNPKRIEISLPLCRPCSGLGEIEILHASWDESSLDLLVHRRFAKALRKLRRE